MVAARTAGFAGADLANLVNEAALLAARKDKTAVEPADFDEAIDRLIPGLENARFERYGSVHRNTFVDSPRVLGDDFALRELPGVYVAGQVSGVEGYVESAAIGLLAGRFAAAEMLGGKAEPPPQTTALGALLAHITKGADASTFQPMNVNFGLFPELPPSGRVSGRDRKKVMAHRALADLDAWLGQTRAAAE